MDWYKLRHGLPYDARLAAVARRSGLKVAEAACLFLCLMDHANSAARRGSVDGFDCELPAALFNRDVAKVETAMAGFRDKGMIDEGNRIAGWEKQGKTGAERQRAYRARIRAREQELKRQRINPDSAEEAQARRSRLTAQALEKSALRPSNQGENA